jgi:hypothetical protein
MVSGMETTTTSSAAAPALVRPRRARTLLAVAAAIVACTLAGAVGAGAQAGFSDVGEGNPFHDQIEQFAGAGISGGYEDGTFRPGAPVTRQAMAAFLTRGLGSAAAVETSNGVAWDVDDAPVDLFDDVTVQAPGEAGGTQQAWILATVNWQINATRAEACGGSAGSLCAFVLGIYVDDVLVGQTNGYISGDRVGGEETVQALTPIATGEPHDVDVRLVTGVNMTGENVLGVGHRQVTVTTFPFVLPTGA